MPLNIRTAKEVLRSVAIPFEGETLNVKYRLGEINIHLDDWLAANEGERGNTMEWVKKLVAEWDIQDNGQNIPVTTEAMEQHEVPTPILAMIINAIYEDASGKNLRNSYAQK